MKPVSLLRSGFKWCLNMGATLSIAVLSFVGMYSILPSFLLCSGAFFLAAAYESQVNGEGIKGAFKRMFDANYLKRGIVERYLEDLINQEDTLIKKAEACIYAGNIFYQDYKKLSQCDGR